MIAAALALTLTGPGFEIEARHHRRHRRDRAAAAVLAPLAGPQLYAPAIKSEPPLRGRPLKPGEACGAAEQPLDIGGQVWCVRAQPDS